MDKIGGFSLSWPEYEGSSRCTVVPILLDKLGEGKTMVLYGLIYQPATSSLSARSILERKPVTKTIVTWQLRVMRNKAHCAKTNDFFPRKNPYI
jgi:hypothetical protein